MQNAKFRTISTRSKAFVERIGDNAAALRLLDIAGFKPTNTSTSASKMSGSAAATSATAVADAESEAVLQMVHYNTSILTLLTQVRSR